MASSVQIYRGDTPLFTFTIKQANGSPLDLTGGKAYFAARPQTGTDCQFNVECTVSAPTTGVATIRLSADNTSMPGVYTAEVEVRFTSSGYIFTVSQFQLTILDDVRK